MRRVENSCGHDHKEHTWEAQTAVTMLRGWHLRTEKRYAQSPALENRKATDSLLRGAIPSQETGIRSMKGSRSNRESKSNRSGRDKNTRAHWSEVTRTQSGRSTHLTLSCKTQLTLHDPGGWLWRLAHRVLER